MSCRPKMPAGEALRIIVDTREQAPFRFEHPLLAGRVVTERGTLATGDYAPAAASGLVAVERKSLDDFVGSITTGRPRFKREIERGAQLDFFAVVIEASGADVLAHNYRSRLEPWVVWQTIGSWSTKHRVPFYLAGSRAAAEVLTYTLLRWAASRCAPWLTCPF